VTDEVLSKVMKETHSATMLVDVLHREHRATIPTLPIRLNQFHNTTVQHTHINGCYRRQSFKEYTMFQKCLEVYLIMCLLFIFIS